MDQTTHIEAPAASRKLNESADDIREDMEQRGEAHNLGTEVRVGPDTRLRVSMPRLATASDGQPLPIPFVLHLGPVLSVHVARTDLERIHALIGRALDTESGRGRTVESR